MPSTSQVSWLRGVVPAAQAGEKVFGVPALVTLAQCVLESRWGTTQLAKLANNYFGIKAEHLEQPNTYEEFPTAEFEGGVRIMIDADFERYPDVESSFRDHARLLATAQRYKPAMAQSTDPCRFAEELQACGYSTSPTYGGSLIALIHEIKGLVGDQV